MFFTFEFHPLIIFGYVGVCDDSNICLDCHCLKFACVCHDVADCSAYVDNGNSMLEGSSECTVSEWGPWGLCSISCGVGAKMRQRFVTKAPENAMGRCSSLIDILPCQATSCGIPSHSLR